MTSWRSSAAYRIAFVYSAVFALGVLLLGIAIFGSIHVAFTRQLDATIVDEATTLVSEYRSDGSGELADAITQREAIRSRAGVLYAVFSADGRSACTTLPLLIHAKGQTRHADTRLILVRASDCSLPPTASQSKRSTGR
jgi:hypothetical protein